LPSQTPQTEPISDNFSFEITPSKPTTVPIYRYTNNKDHFYTASKDEIGTDIPGQKGAHGYTSEGIAFYLAESEGAGLSPVYRYFKTPDHFYSADPNEIGETVQGKKGKHGYTCEGVIGYISETKTDESVPVYRYYKAPDHFYTTNTEELGISEIGDEHNGWKLESILGYAWVN